MPSVSAARYGKDNVRVCKVHRDAATGTQTVTEMTVCCLLEGDIASSYTQGDNSVVVATDSIKNTIYIKAKEHAVDPPELYGGLLGQHFLDTYSHIHAANVSVVVHRWTRMTVGDRPHPHSFLRDGDETRRAEVRVTRDGGIVVTSGIAGLLVLKSTGSQFHGFVRDEYTTLPETWDRILSTDIDATWRWTPIPTAAALQEKAAAGAFDRAWEDARRIALTTFAEEDSPSVQGTMYKISEQVLEAAPDVSTVSLSLPNKHYFEIGKLKKYCCLSMLSLRELLLLSSFYLYPEEREKVLLTIHVDLSWHKGIKNTGKDAEVYAPQSGPNGLIKVEVSRS